MKQTPLAAPIDAEALKAELRPDMLLRSFRGLEVYVTTARESPALMSEIGRIREREYRAVGAGRGDSRDIDDHDTSEVCYKQIVAWDPEHRQIVALYRSLFGAEAMQHLGPEALRTGQLFEFSPRFVDEYVPVSVELGRSVVNRDAARAMTGLFAVWAGLGAIVAEFPCIRYLFGNVSIYPAWPPRAVDTLLAYLYEAHPGPSLLVCARPERAYRSPAIEALRAGYRGLSIDEAFSRLLSRLKELSVAPPPILLSYLKATDALAVFDTVLDSDFGNSLETFLWVPTESLNQRTRHRFVESYGGRNASAVRRLCPVPLPSRSSQGGRR